MTKIFFPAIPFLAVVIMCSCSQHKTEEKGFQVLPEPAAAVTDTGGLHSDTVKIATQPGGVLLTGLPKIRLTTVFKVNIGKDNKSIYTGSNLFIENYDERWNDESNNWNYNIMPGFDACYGFNLVNVSHYDLEKGMQKFFFDKPVLIKTLYFPACSRDTLNGQPVQRNFFMVSVYNDDTNKDGFINLKDLRRFYLFDQEGVKKKELIPENYSVFQSEYDPANDLMYVYATFDKNLNGRAEKTEPVHIFWIDLKNPESTGRQY